jgi:hypothetical protein
MDAMGMDDLRFWADGCSKVAEWKREAEGADG